MTKAKAAVRSLFSVLSRKVIRAVFLFIGRDLSIMFIEI